MKRYKLRNWVRVLLTIMIFISAVLVYENICYRGELAQTSDTQGAIYILECFYIIFIQPCLYSVIWGE